MRTSRYSNEAGQPLCEQCRAPLALAMEYRLYCSIDCAQAADAKRKERNAKARTRRRGIADAYASLGLVRVKGALGGTYWE